MPVRSRIILTAAAVAAIALLGPAAGAAERLPSLGADPRQTTASGLSSGAFMAVQFHVAFSATVQGAGVVAGGPYYCAEGQLQTNALNRCMQTTLGPPDPARLLALAHGLARAGSIDPLENLADDRAYLFAGTRDRTVVAAVTDAARRFYLLAGLPAANLVYRADLPAGHGMVTEDAGGACARTAAPYINDCDFDLAGAMLAHLYPGLTPPPPPATAPPSGGTLLAFDQTEFFPSGAAAGSGWAWSWSWFWPWRPPAPALGLNDTGFVYIPAACAARTETCRVHIAFHGCRQTVDDVREQFVRNAGYNRWADVNAIVVLYPQARSESGVNPNGCWDWWGYSGPDYATQAGPQMAALRAMLDRLAGR